MTPEATEPVINNYFGCMYYTVVEKNAQFCLRIRFYLNRTVLLLVV